MLANNRVFFTWACQEKPRYQDLAPSWIASLRLPRSVSAATEVKVVQSWTLEEVLAVAALPVGSPAARRDQAAIAFLYLSGMRVGAFTTLPIACVDVEKRLVHQLPARGVQTKNHKAAITTLLPIPELVAVVAEWDTYVRAALPGHCLWYPRIECAGGDVSPAPIGTLSSRRNALCDGIRSLAARAGVPYRSPHKLRHGHALYGVQHARTIEELKAVSQNLMHSSLTITDGIYGRLPIDNLRSAIAGLSGPAASVAKAGASGGVADVAAALPVVASALQADPGLLARLC